MSNWESLLLLIPLLVFSVVVHEVAHGWVALKQGDDTALRLGRLTLNPFPHLDPVGSVILPALLAFSGAPVLGWAKPVPVDPSKYRHFRRGDILVSLAGVAANLLLVLLFALVLVVVVRVGGGMPAQGSAAGMLVLMMMAGIQVNLALIVFNLIPIPPLDGSHVVAQLLPPRLAARYVEVGRYGMVILFGLLFLGGLSFLRPVVRGGLEAVLVVVNALV